MKSFNVKSITIEYYNGDKEFYTRENNLLEVQTVSWNGVPWFANKYNDLTSLRYEVTFSWIQPLTE